MSTYVLRNLSMQCSIEIVSSMLEHIVWRIRTITQPEGGDPPHNLHLKLHMLVLWTFINSFARPCHFSLHNCLFNIKVPGSVEL